MLPPPLLALDTLCTSLRVAADVAMRVGMYAPAAIRLSARAMCTLPVPEATSGLTLRARSTPWANVRCRYGKVESPGAGAGAHGWIMSLLCATAPRATPNVTHVA